MSPRFPLGRVVATPAAVSTMERFGIDAASLLTRHLSGDWGDLGDEDKHDNNGNVALGRRILSAYGAGDAELWVITEGNRSVTTILRPEDY
jgi:hypothetical protein